MFVNNLHETYCRVKNVLKYLLKHKKEKKINDPPGVNILINSENINRMKIYLKYNKVMST